MKATGLILLLLLAMQVKSQTRLICVPDSNFSYPNTPLRAGLTGSFWVYFDVVNRRPANIQIRTRYSSIGSSEHFESSIRDNLRMLFYRGDTAGVRINVRYELSPPGHLNRSYAELTCDTVLRIVAPDRLHPNGLFCGPRVVDFFSDTSTLNLSIPFKGAVPGHSDILVRRLFIGTADSIVIVHNNCPEYEAEILQAAAKCSKFDFLDNAPNATQFFIRFRILHYSLECQCTELL